MKSKTKRSFHTQRISWK